MVMLHHLHLTSCFLLTISSLSLANYNDNDDDDGGCLTDCSTWSETLKLRDQTSPTSNRVNCTIKNEICFNLKTDASSYYVSEPDVDYNIYVHNDSIALNVTFRPKADVTVTFLQAYLLQVNITDRHNNLKRQVEKYFCINDNRLTFNEHSQMEFSFACIHDMLPGDHFNIRVKALPQLPDYQYGAKVKRGTVPLCEEDKSFNSVAFCKLIPKIEQVRNEECSNYAEVNVYMPAQLGPEVIIISLPFRQKLWSKILRVNETFLNETIKLKLLPGNHTLLLYGSERLKINGTLSLHLPQCPNNIAISIMGVMVVFFVIFLLSLCFYHKLKKRLRYGGAEMSESKKHFVQTRVELASKRTKVYLGYYDNDETFLNLIDHFAHYLTSSLGLEVVFERWNEEEIHQGLTQWVEKILSSCDKFILVWSSASIALLQDLDKAATETSDNSSFIPIALQLKSELLKGTMKKNNFLSVYFDACYAKHIPTWFCRLIDRHFLLMEQFNELYFSTVDREPFNPGKKLIVDFKQIESDFEYLLKCYRGTINGEKGKSYKMVNYINILPFESDEYDENDVNIIPPSICDEMENNFDIIKPPQCNGEELVINLIDM